MGTSEAFVVGQGMVDVPQHHIPYTPSMFQYAWVVHTRLHHNLCNPEKHMK